MYLYGQVLRERALWSNVKREVSMDQSIGKALIYSTLTDLHALL